jgi:hypothetical protein
VADDDALFAQVVAERVGDLVVEEGQQPVAGVHQVHLDVQVAHDGGVLAADDAGAVDGHAARRVLEPQHRVAVEHARVREVHVRRMVGARAGGDDDMVRPQESRRRPGAAHRPDSHRRSGPAEHHLDPVALVVAVAGAHLMVDDRVRRPQQVRELHVHLVQGVVEQRVAPIVRQHLDGVAQRLARDGAPVGAAAAHLVVGLDHRHPAPALASFMAAPSPAGPAEPMTMLSNVAYCHGVLRAARQNNLSRTG